MRLRSFRRDDATLLFRILSDAADARVIPRAVHASLAESEALGVTRRTHVFVKRG